MKLQFLGTGAGIPAKARNVTSIALKLLEEKGSIWLFDCGEATQHQILHTSIKPRRIDKVFITHLHGDHLYGLPGFLASRSFQGGETPLTVYGPKGISEYVRISLAVSQTYLKYELRVVEIEEGVILEDNDFIVEARTLEHGVTSFGYRIIEKDRPGKLDKDKLLQYGIKPGPIYKKIKDGEDLILDDGTVISSQNFLGPKIKGRIITILGDTRTCDAAKELAREAKVLVHEATFSEKEASIASEYFHSTTVQAAETAKKADVDCLLLTHISARYDQSLIDQLLQEAKAIFPNTYIAEDFSEFDI
ncbi:ribonuclease Z [Niallia sp.]|uniref:ribonuclease Z n=1 Tax=Niallia sp. TaxID=2837523 RepID=UPI00289B31EB|nr:ribonuclease Z [Niallia sp.]